MAGSWNLFDFVDLTADSESSPRTRAIDTLQIHHGTIISYSGLRSLMDPGGRQVSANGAMANDGSLGEVVPTPTRRAFTSSSSFDNQCLTVEACNTTLGPEWGISAATRTRFARLAVGMYRLGLLKHLGRGVGGIIGHYEVPGTYATACPGPDMHLDAIAAEAQALFAAGDTGLAGGGVVPIEPKDNDMHLINSPSWRNAQKDVLITAGAGAHEVPWAYGIAATLRRSVGNPVELDYDHDLLAQVDLAWRVAGISTGQTVDQVAAKIAEWSEISTDKILEALAAEQAQGVGTTS